MPPTLPKNRRGRVGGTLNAQLSTPNSPHGTVLVLIIALLAMLALALLVSTPAFAKSVVKVAFIGSDDPYVSVDGATAVVFKNLVETGTNGEIEVRLFPGGVLGQEREMMEMLKGGMIQVHLATAGSMGSFFPLYGVFDIPYLIPNYSVAYDVWDGPFGKQVDDVIMEFE